MFYGFESIWLSESLHSPIIFTEVWSFSISNLGLSICEQSIDFASLCFKNGFGCFWGTTVPLLSPRSYFDLIWDDPIYFFFCYCYSTAIVYRIISAWFCLSTSSLVTGLTLQKTLTFPLSWSIFSCHNFLLSYPDLILISEFTQKFYIS